MCGDLKEIQSHQNQVLSVTDCMFFFPRVKRFQVANQISDGFGNKLKKGSMIYVESHKILEKK